MAHVTLLDAAYDSIRVVHGKGAKWPTADAASASDADIVQPTGN
jgi:hypothetical protein